MRAQRSFLRLILLLFLVMGACTPGRGPSGETTAPPSALTPSVVSVNLGGPEMAVGSTYLYADGTLLVAVPAGMFTMGNGDSGNRPENPAHLVNLTDYWIYRTEVTNRQYDYCIQMGACTPPSGTDNPGFSDYLLANHPVVGVNYQQAADYCAFVHARLPTEAEWEKAARGPDPNLYPWGDEAPSCALLNYANCLGETTQVDAYPAGQSHYTAYDLEGNVLEWVADWYGDDYYLGAPADDPQGPAGGRDRSVRSSAFNSGGDQIPAYTRSYSRPETHRDNLGFRCVVDDPTHFAPYCEYPAIYGADGFGGSSSGLEISVECPPLVIYQNPTCSGNTPITMVAIGGTLGLPPQTWWVEDLSGTCTGAPSQYTCTGPGQVRVCAYCDATVTFPPRCPDQYVWDESSQVCLGAGTGDACLPGTALDPTGQCCTVVPGTGAPTAAPLFGSVTSPRTLTPSSVCPAGTWQFHTGGGQWQCVAVPVQNPYCITEGITLKSCTPDGGDDDGGGCQITQASCESSCLPYGYIYDPAACSCSCLTG